MFGIPAILENRIRLVRRPGIRSCERGSRSREGVSAAYHGPNKRRNATALTDNKRCPVPYAVLVDGIIPQQRAAHVLQVRTHRSLPDVERMGALHRVKLRQRIHSERRSDTLDVFWVQRGWLANKRITTSGEVRTRSWGWYANAKLGIHISIAIRVGRVCGGLSWCGRGPTSDEAIIHRFDLCDRGKMTIGASGRRQRAVLKSPDKRSAGRAATWVKVEAKATKLTSLWAAFLRACQPALSMAHDKRVEKKRWMRESSQVKFK
jgi:hypothetical protein